MATEVTNFYSIMPAKLRPRAHNPNYAQHRLKIPFRGLIVGSSGSMKTNCALNLIKAFNGTFHNIFVVTKNSDEPLYNFLKTACAGVKIVEGIAHIPALDTFKKEENSLVIFDDMVLDDQTYINSYYVRCRKLNISVLFLSQSYFATSKMIRKNLTFLILKKVGTTRELKAILQENSLGVDLDALVAMYRFAIGDNPADKTHWLMIDLEGDDQDRFRKDMTPISYHIS